jgi:murein DD-endopeptidase MepM/ murein hydrolase activator NlpD
MQRLIVVAALAAITIGAAYAQAAEAVDTVVAARSLQPGELIVFTSTVSAKPSRVEVTLFGRHATAFPLADGRWRALVGIDLDQKPGSYTATIDATFASGVVHESQAIVVKPKTFATRTLTVSPDFVNPPASQLARIERDSAFLKEIFAASADHRLWNRSFLAPVPDPANSRFGTRSVFNGERRNPHGGADFASPLGRPVKAPNGGKVVGARELFYTGNVVIIDHGLGMFSLLAHLSRVDVKEGDDVKAGDVVGLVGATGRVTGPHLHWALTVMGARVDPVSALAVLGDVADDVNGAPGRRGRTPK